MGSATTQALAAQARALDAVTVDLGTARELFAAARALSESQALSGALADSAAAPESRVALVSSVFGSFSEASRSLLTSAAEQRWSSAAEFLSGIEELAVRTAAKAESADLSGELFRVSRIVAENGEFELALGSRLGDADAKSALVEKVLGGRASEGTVLIVASLVQLAAGRRVRGLLTRAMQLVAAQRGRTVATVHTARPLSDAQADRLRAHLANVYGGEIAINEVADPSVVGGIRVQIADDVIDGSIVSRLADVRQRLAG